MCKVSVNFVVKFLNLDRQYDAARLPRLSESMDVFSRSKLRYLSVDIRASLYGSYQ